MKKLLLIVWVLVLCSCTESTPQSYRDYRVMISESDLLQKGMFEEINFSFDVLNPLNVLGQDDISVVRVRIGSIYCADKVISWMPQTPMDVLNFDVIAGKSISSMDQVVSSGGVGSVRQFLEGEEPTAWVDTVYSEMDLKTQESSYIFSTPQHYFDFLPGSSYILVLKETETLGRYAIVASGYGAFEEGKSEEDYLINVLTGETVSLSAFEIIFGDEQGKGV